MAQRNMLRETAQLSEDGALTWPNGYDWDPIALHDEMKDAGELRPIGDAAE
jgi:hypothetical protein